MTTFWQMPYGQDPEDPDAIDVTGFGDPYRSFLPAPRDPSPAELAEFRAAFLREAGDPARTVIMPEGTVTERAIVLSHRGQCQDCGMDGDVTIWGRCTYCAELADLRLRNLPGPPLAWWWYLLPAVTGAALGLVLVWAILYVIFYG